MSLLFNMLSRLVITFLPRSKRLLVSWLQSPSAVTLEPKKIKSDTVWLFRNGSWVFLFVCLCIFWSRICPNWGCTQLFLVPHSFFVFCYSRRHVSKCKFCSIAAKGPRSQLGERRSCKPLNAAKKKNPTYVYFFVFR